MKEEFCHQDWFICRFCEMTLNADEKPFAMTAVLLC